MKPTTPLSSTIRKLMNPALFAAVAVPGMAFATPFGEEVIRGVVSIERPDAVTTLVNQGSDRAVVNWQSFSVGGQNYVIFNQPNASSVILNRVIGNNASEILGTIQANGRVFLVNPNGIFFGPGAELNVNSLLATTLDIDNDDFMEGRYLFTRTGDADGEVRNAGTIQAADGGFVVLAGDYVENTGVIAARLGHVVLAAGDHVTLDMDGDGLIAFAVNERTLAELAGVRNTGEILADGSIVIMTAAVARELLSTVVNNEGLIAAQSVAERNGVIYLNGIGGHVENSGALIADAIDDGVNGGVVLVRSDHDITHTSGSVTSANGAADSTGGTVRIVASGTLLMESGSTISARGGQRGGFVEVSGHTRLALDGDISIGNGGELLIDPVSLTIVSGAGGPGGNTEGSTIGVEFIENLLNDDTQVRLVAEELITADLDVTSITSTGTGVLRISIGTVDWVADGDGGFVAATDPDCVGFGLCAWTGPAFVGVDSALPADFALLNALPGGQILLGHVNFNLGGSLVAAALDGVMEFGDIHVSNGGGIQLGSAEAAATIIRTGALSTGTGIALPGLFGDSEVYGYQQVTFAVRTNPDGTPALVEIGGPVNTGLFSGSFESYEYTEAPGIDSITVGDISANRIVFVMTNSHSDRPFELTTGNLTLRDPDANWVATNQDTLLSSPNYHTILVLTEHTGEGAGAHTVSLGNLTTGASGQVSLVAQGDGVSLSIGDITSTAGLYISANSGGVIDVVTGNLTVTGNVAPGSDRGYGTLVAQVSGTLTTGDIHAVSTDQHGILHLHGYEGITTGSVTLYGTPTDLSGLEIPEGEPWLYADTNLDLWSANGAVTVNGNVDVQTLDPSGIVRAHLRADQDTVTVNGNITVVDGEHPLFVFPYIQNDMRLIGQSVTVTGQVDSNYSFRAIATGNGLGDPTQATLHIGNLQLHRSILQSSGSTVVGDIFATRSIAILGAGDITAGNVTIIAPDLADHLDPIWSITGQAVFESSGGGDVTLGDVHIEGLIASNLTATGANVTVGNIYMHARAAELHYGEFDFPFHPSAFLRPSDITSAVGIRGNTQVVLGNWMTASVVATGNIISDAVNSAAVFIEADDVTVIGQIASTATGASYSATGPLDADGNTYQLEGFLGRGWLNIIGRESTFIGGDVSIMAPSVNVYVNSPDVTMQNVTLHATGEELEMLVFAADESLLGTEYRNAGHAEFTVDGWADSTGSFGDIVVSGSGYVTLRLSTASLSAGNIDVDVSMGSAYSDGLFDLHFTESPGPAAWNYGLGYVNLGYWGSPGAVAVGDVSFTSYGDDGHLSINGTDIWAGDIYSGTNANIEADGSLMVGSLSGHHFYLNANGSILMGDFTYTGGDRAVMLHLHAQGDIQAGSLTAISARPEDAPEWLTDASIYFFTNAGNITVADIHIETTSSDGVARAHLQTNSGDVHVTGDIVHRMSANPLFVEPFWNGDVWLEGSNVFVDGLIDSNYSLRAIAHGNGLSDPLDAQLVFGDIIGHRVLTWSEGSTTAGNLTLSRSVAFQSMGDITVGNISIVSPPEGEVVDLLDNLTAQLVLDNTFGSGATITTGNLHTDGLISSSIFLRGQHIATGAITQVVREIDWNSTMPRGPFFLSGFILPQPSHVDYAEGTLGYTQLIIGTPDTESVTVGGEISVHGHNLSNVNIQGTTITLAGDVNITVDGTDHYYLEGFIPDDSGNTFVLEGDIGRAALFLTGTGTTTVAGDINITGPAVRVQTNVGTLVANGMNLTATGERLDMEVFDADGVFLGREYREGGFVDLWLNTGSIQTADIAAIGSGRVDVRLNAGNVTTGAVAITSGTGSVISDGVWPTTPWLERTGTFDIGFAALTVGDGSGVVSIGPTTLLADGSATLEVMGTDVSLGDIILDAVYDGWVEIQATNLVVAGNIDIAVQATYTMFSEAGNASDGQNSWDVEYIVDGEVGFASLTLLGANSVIVGGTTSVTSMDATVEIAGGDVTLGDVMVTATGGTVTETIHYTGSGGADFTAGIAITGGGGAIIDVSANGSLTTGDLGVQGSGLAALFLTGQNVETGSISVATTSASLVVTDTRNMPHSTAHLVGEALVSISGGATVQGDMNIQSDGSVRLGVDATVNGTVSISATNDVTADIPQLVLDLLAWDGTDVFGDSADAALDLGPTNVSANGILINAGGSIFLGGASFAVHGPITGFGDYNQPGVSGAIFPSEPVTSPSIVFQAGFNAQVGTVTNNGWTRFQSGLASLGEFSGGAGSVLQWSPTSPSIVMPAGTMAAFVAAGSGSAGSWTVLGSDGYAANITVSEALNAGPGNLLFATSGNITGSGLVSAHTVMTLDASTQVSLVTNAAELSLGGQIVSVDNSAVLSDLHLTLGPTTMQANIATGGSIFLDGSYSLTNLGLSAGGDIHAPGSSLSISGMLDFFAGGSMHLHGVTMEAQTLRLHAGGNILGGTGGSFAGGSIHLLTTGNIDLGDSSITTIGTAGTVAGYAQPRVMGLIANAPDALPSIVLDAGGNIAVGTMTTNGWAVFLSDNATLGTLSGSTTTVAQWRPRTASMSQAAMQSWLDTVDANFGAWAVLGSGGYTGNIDVGAGLIATQARVILATDGNIGGTGLVSVPLLWVSGSSASQVNLTTDVEWLGIGSGATIVVNNAAHLDDVTLRFANTPVGIGNVAFTSGGGVELRGGAAGTITVGGLAVVADGDIDAVGRVVNVSGALQFSTTGDILLSGATIQSGTLQFVAGGGILNATPASLSAGHLVLIAVGDIQLGQSTVTIGSGTSSDTVGDPDAIALLAQNGLVPANATPNGVIISAGDLALGTVTLGGNYLWLMADSLDLGSFNGPAGQWVVQLVPYLVDQSFGLEQTEAGDVGTAYTVADHIGLFAGGTVILGSSMHEGDAWIGTSGPVNIGNTNLLVATTGSIQDLSTVVSSGLVGTLLDGLAGPRSQIKTPTVEEILPDTNPASEVASEDDDDDEETTGDDGVQEDPESRDGRTTHDTSDGGLVCEG